MRVDTCVRVCVRVILSVKMYDPNMALSGREQRN